MDITGYQGTAHRRRIASHRDAVVQRDDDAHDGQPLDAVGPRIPALPRDERLLREQPDGPVQLRRHLDARPARQPPPPPRVSSDSRSRRSCSASPRAVSIAVPASYDERSATWGFFVQDDWRVNSKLTVNLGLRYEFETALSEANNQSVRGFDFDAVQPMEAAARAAYANNPTPEVPASAVQRARRPAVRRRQRPAERPLQHAEGQPHAARRLCLPARTRTRWCAAATACSTDSSASAAATWCSRGFSQNTNLVVSLDNGLTFIETLSNPFQNGLQPAVGAALGIETLLGNSVTFFDENPKSPRMQRWQIGMQRTVGKWLTEVTYVGNYGSQIETNRNLNAMPLEYLSTSPTRDSARNSYLTRPGAQPVLQPDADHGRRGVPRRRPSRAQQLLRPYPHFDDGQHDDQRGAVVVRRDAASTRAPLLGRLHGVDQLHLLALHAGDRVPQRGGSGADARSSPIRTCRTGSRSAASTSCRSARAGSMCRPAGLSACSSAAGRSRASMRSSVACRSGSATSSSPATRTT